MAFEEYIQGPAHNIRSDEPAVSTKTYRGCILLTLNSAAIKKWKMAEYKYVKLYFDLLTKEIGLGFVPEPVAGSRKLSASGWHNSSYSLSVTTFFRYYNIDPKLYEYRPLSLRDGLLVFGPSAKPDATLSPNPKQ